MKKKVGLIVTILIILLVIILILLSWREQRAYSGPVQSIISSSAQIERGAYVAIAANCAACHSSEAQGGKYAGGVPLVTVFGTIYGSNITPSADHGIGRWTSDDLYKSFTHGVTPSGRHLYPAMPYTTYHSMSREDSDDIYAYLMSLPAIEVPSPKHDLSFPYNQSMLMIGWNMLFLDKGKIKDASIGSSQEWERGRYLANALGHCSVCHTPSGTFGQMDGSKQLQGGTLGAFHAPNITPSGLRERQWTASSLHQYLSTGRSAQGTAFGEMHEVIKLSLQHLTPTDMNSLVIYLMGDEVATELAKVEATSQEARLEWPPVTDVSRSGLQTAAVNEGGRQTYLNVCAACHMPSGVGRPYVATALVGNATVNNINAHNLIKVILEGVEVRGLPESEYLQRMPAFKDQLSDEEIAQLVNYLRVEWGKQIDDVKSNDVAKLR